MLKVHWYMKFIYLFLVFLFLAKCSSTPKVGLDTSLVAMVLKDRKYGFINPKGEYVIEPQYPLARPFSNGLACVNIGGVRSFNSFLGKETVSGGKYVFIDLSNNKVIESELLAFPSSFYENMALIEYGENNKGKYGYINKKGELVAESFDALSLFEDGLAAAAKSNEELLGYIDTLGNWKIKLEFKYFIEEFSEGFALIEEDKKCGFINKQGQVVIQPTYDKATSFREGVAAVSIDGKYGFIDKNGEVVIQPTYENVSSFSDGLCAVKLNNMWGYINKKGEVKIDFKFHNVRDFHNGCAAVTTKTSGKAGIISKLGQWIVKPTFDNIYSFKNGYAPIVNNGKLGYINTNGEVIIQPQFERVGFFIKPYESNKVMTAN